MHAALTYRAAFKRVAGQNGLPSGVSDDTEFQEIEMPKMKTKSSAKKRFKLTATGKVRGQQVGKRHGMIKRSNKFIRDARGTTILAEADARIVRKMMPYG